MARNGTPRSKDSFRIYMIHGPAEYEQGRHLRNDLLRELNVHAVLTEDTEAKPDSLASARRELERADLVVALLTPLSVKSSNVLEQLGGAWALEKQIIPVITKRAVLNGLPQSVVESPSLVEAGTLADPKARSRVIERVRKALESFLVSA